MQLTRGKLTFTLLVLLGINTMNFYDRQVVGAIGEKVRIEWGLNDRQLSDLTIAFILLYAVVGLPLGRMADVGRRRLILSGGVLLWSVLTGLSGLAWNFASLFVFRLGVGVGEASCAPAANSLLGDLFPAQKRARALAVFMLGLPLGLGLSYVISGLIAQFLTWQAALFVAGVPGLILGMLALWLPEPVRGAAEQQPASANSTADPVRDMQGGAAPPGPQTRSPDTAGLVRAAPEMAAQPMVVSVAFSAHHHMPKKAHVAVLDVLRIPTMWWIILSGALLNLNMYALGSFLTSFQMRFHGLNIAQANWVSGVVYGFGGSLGLLGGGWLCDRIVGKRVNGRLQLAALAMFVGAPCLWLALEQERGNWLAFAIWLLPGCMCLYFYYAAVYATIQDIVAPAMRGTAMAVYFFVFYLVAAAGLRAFGKLSDHLAQQALDGGASAKDAPALGLHGALYVVPLLTAALVGVLFAGSLTVTRDHQKLHSGDLAA
jgi:MFS family permease